MCDNMNDNPCYNNSCVNRSPARSPTRAQCSPMSEIDDLGGPALKIEEQLNEVYERRLVEINEEAAGDANLKEITYKEWIEMLRQINKTLITNIQEMEHETSERLTLLQRKVSSGCRYNQDSEVCKLRKDMAGLMQLVRNGRSNGDWSVDKFNFETITENDIFGNEIASNQPAIKYETECSRQGNATDSKITCAHQKSKCTGARTSDRTRLNLCFSVMSSESGGADNAPFTVDSAGSGGSYSNRDSINSLNCITDNISSLNIADEDEEEEEFVKCLKEELAQFFEMRRSYDQNVDEQRRAIVEQQARLSDMVDKLLKSNTDLQNRLRYYRRELPILDGNQQSSRTLRNCSDDDSGISSDADPDVKMVNMVRARITGLMDDNQRLRRQEQCLQIKYEDANCRALAKSDLLEKTSKTLREVADALSNSLCKPIAYDKIFGDCPNMSNNPIVDAVDELMETVKEKDKTIEELEERVSSSEKVNQELELNSEKLLSELNELKQSISAESQHENRGSLLQNQEFLMKVLEKNEDLKCKICKQDEQICALRRQLAQYRDAPCGRCGTRTQADCSQRNDRRPPAPSESTEELQKLEHELRRKSKAVDSLKSQNAKLNDELCEIRRSQARMKLLQRRGHSSYTETKQEDVVEPMHPDEDYMAKLNAANERNQEQSKSLQRASKDIDSLQQEIQDLRAKEETFNKEVRSSIQENQISINKEPLLANTQRDLLQTELIALKERQASQMGTQQSLQEQLQGTIKELYVAKEKLHESMQLKERIESVHREEMKRFQDLKADMFEKYNNLVEDYNNVLKEYQKVVQIEQEKTNQLRAFNAWKDEQVQSEREICRKMQMYEDHIKDLLEDKQRLLDKLSETENDNRTLLQTIERTRMAQSSNQYGRVSSPSRGYNVVAASSSTDPVSKVIENVRCTSRRLSQQRCMLQEEYYSTIN